ncbi:MAG TPA: S-methyl-5'-thioadenosine phosphorylase [Nitrospirota bacterium]|nr:S-methyl-5'-thioadenosine phosphorylase [Nitrospirota bacterium]
MAKRSAKQEKITIGVIGGSGLYDMEGLTQVKTVKVATPFGKPSDDYVIGTLFGRRVAFLPRHGRGHRIMPTDINYRANIFGMKKLGVERIISVSAVGSMKEEIKPGDIVIPDQFYDHTKHRRSTFFGGGIVAHVGMADPVCADLGNILADAGAKAGAAVHKGGTYLCMEGPQFSTRAESLIYRTWNADVIGMTNATEAKLAREAELCYSTIALATDYDCWHHSEEAVTVEAVLAVMKKNIETSKAMIREAVRMLPAARSCSCGDALRNTIMTPEKLAPAKTKRDLTPIIGKYMNKK